MGKYLELLDRAALQERRRDKSDQSDERSSLHEVAAPFGRLCRFGRRPGLDGADPTWTEAEEERAAIVEFDGGAPKHCMDTSTKHWVERRDV